MVPADLIRDVFSHVAQAGALGTGCATGIDGLYAIANEQTTECVAGFYEPTLCLVLQGAKEAYLGGRVVRYSAGDVLIVSHAVPVEAAVIKANREEPYTALALQLDLSLARRLYDELGEFAEADGTRHSLNVAASDDALVDAISRLFHLSKDPVDARALAPLVLEEIHFRLLRAKHAGMLRRVLQHDSAASRISKTIATIRGNFKSAVTVAELASECGMSVSAFHGHFKSVTGTTPLQYQKDLRLLEARRLLSAQGVSVATVAYEVGYESPTQFSREYSRKFGLSPSTQKLEGRALTG